MRRPLVGQHRRGGARRAGRTGSGCRRRRRRYPLRPGRTRRRGSTCRPAGSGSGEGRAPGCRAVSAGDVAAIRAEATGAGYPRSRCSPRSRTPRSPTIEIGPLTAPHLRADGRRRRGAGRLDRRPLHRGHGRHLPRGDLPDGHQAGHRRHHRRPPHVRRLAHWETVDSPIDIIAVWEGGLQFSGGFIGAIIFGLPFFRRWDRLTRWRRARRLRLRPRHRPRHRPHRLLRGGRALRSHHRLLPRRPLRRRPTREGLEPQFPTPADLQLDGVGTVFHQTALYEFLYLLVLFGVLTLLIRRRPPVATAHRRLLLRLRRLPVLVRQPPGERRDGRWA